MAESKSMRYSVQVLGAIVVVAFLVVWLGVPTFNKWRADRLVDELCAKDGGINIYETVELPQERFNNLGQVNLPTEENVKDSVDYFQSCKSSNIEGDRNMEPVSRLAIWKTNCQVIRTADKKVIAELIMFTRRGGDPVGPWHPSSHICPRNSNWKSVFVKQ